MCNTPWCGKTLKTIDTIFILKNIKRTRLIAEPKGKNSIVIGQSADQFLTPLRQGYGAVSTTERVWVHAVRPNQS